MLQHAADQAEAQVTVDHGFAGLSGADTGLGKHLMEGLLFPQGTVIGRDITQAGGMAQQVAQGDALKGGGVPAIRKHNGNGRIQG